MDVTWLKKRQMKSAAWRVCPSNKKYILTCLNLKTISAAVESEDVQFEVERSLNLSMESLAMTKASAAWNKSKLKDILDHTGASKWSQLGYLTNKTLVCILRDRVGSGLDF